MSSTTTTADSRRGPAQAWLLAFSMLAIYVGLCCVRHAPLLFFQDSVHYLSLAQHLAAGDGYRSSLHFFHDLLQPPLFPLLIAAGIRLGATPVLAAMGVCLLASVATLWALVGIHDELWGGSGDIRGPADPPAWARGRLLTAALAAVYPNLAIASEFTLEPLFLALLSWSVCLALRALRRDRLSLLPGAGLLVGLAFLVRSEAVLTTAMLLALVVMWRGRLRARLLRVAVVGLFAAAVLLPYGLWMRGQLGYFELLPKIRYNFYVPDITRHMAWEAEQTGLVARDQRTLYALMPDHATFILNHAFAHPEFDPRPLYPRTDQAAPGPATAARALLAAVRSVAHEAIVETGLFDPLALACLVATLWWAVRAAWPALRPRRRQGQGDDDEAGRAVLTLFCFALVGAHLLPALLSGEDLETRYLAVSLGFALPLIAGGAACGSDWLARRLAGGGGGRGGAGSITWPGIALPVALILMFGFHTRLLVNHLSGGSLVRERMRALERAADELIPPGARVLADHARYAWLRGGRSYHLPYVESSEELLAYVRAHQIGYAILDSRTLAKHPSAILRGLVEPRTWPPGWTPLRKIEGAPQPMWIVKLTP